MNVRDGTNNATADVAFDSTVLISDQSVVNVTSVGTSGYSLAETMSFVSFYSTHSAYVTKWYDQSGNGNDASHATAADQPYFVNSGVLTVVNSLPSVLWNSNSQYLATLFCLLRIKDICRTLNFQLGKSFLGLEIFVSCKNRLRSLSLGPGPKNPGWIFASSVNSFAYLRRL